MSSQKFQYNKNNNLWLSALAFVYLKFQVKNDWSRVYQEFFMNLCIKDWFIDAWHALHK